MNRLLISLISFIFSTSVFAGTFKVISAAFTDGQPIPVLFTCEGKDISPALSFENTPTNAQSLAVVVSDPDAPNGTYYHWIVYNLPTSTKLLKQGVTFANDGNVVKNNWGNARYNGPCPPGNKPHHYYFTAYALDSNLNFNKNSDMKQALSEIEKHTMAKAQLVGIYVKTKH